MVGAGTPTGVAIGYLVSLVGLAFLAWYVVLVVIGATQARRVGYGGSVGGFVRPVVRRARHSYNPADGGRGRRHLYSCGRRGAPVRSNEKERVCFELGEQRA